MKKIMIPVFCMFVCLCFSSCQKDAFLTENNKLRTEEVALGNLYEAIASEMRERSDGAQYITKYDPQYGKPDIKRGFKVMGVLNRSGYSVEYDELKIVVEESIRNHGMITDSYDTRNAIHLQHFSYELGHRAAFRMPPNEERKAIVLENLEILFNQKAIDTDAYVEMLLESASIMSEEDYTRHRNYISGVATSIVDKFERNWKELQRKMEATKDSESKMEKYDAYFEARFEAIAYKQAKDALAMLNPTASD